MYWKDRFLERFRSGPLRRELKRPARITLPEKYSAKIVFILWFMFTELCFRLCKGFKPIKKELTGGCHRSFFLLFLSLIRAFNFKWLLRLLFRRYPWKYSKFLAWYYYIYMYTVFSINLNALHAKWSFRCKPESLVI